MPTCGPSLRARVAKALSEAGIPALDARELLDQDLPEGRTIDEAAEGRTVVAWDVDLVDVRRFPIRDSRSVLVLGYPEHWTQEDVIRHSVKVLFKNRLSGSGTTIVVLEPRAERALITSQELPIRTAA